MSDYDNTVAELTEKLTGLGGIVTQVTDDPDAGQNPHRARPASG